MTEPAAPTPADGAAPTGAPTAAPGGAGSAAADTAPAVTPAPQGTDAAIAAARTRLQEGKSVLDTAPAGATDETMPKAQTAGDEATPSEAEPDEEETHEEPSFEVTLDPLDERGEQPIILEAPDEESYNRLNRLRNEAKLGREIKDRQADLERAQEELAQVEDMIGIDPVGFVSEHLPQQHRASMALHLFMEPATLAAVDQYLAERAEKLGDGAPASLSEILDDPRALRELQADVRADRAELRTVLQRQTQERRAVKASAERVKAEVQRLIPPEITGQKRDLLFRDTIRDIRERCDRLGIRNLEPVEIQLLVKERFAAYGVKPYVDGGGSPRAAADAPASAAPSAPSAKTAAEFQAARASRRAAAAAAPAGVGAPAASPRPQLPATTEERIQLARKVGLRRLLGHS